MGQPAVDRYWQNPSAVSAGSLFVYHGRRRGILITFPTQQELADALGPDSVRERV